MDKPQPQYNNPTEQPQRFDLREIESENGVQLINIQTPEGVLTCRVSMGENGLLLEIDGQSIEVPSSSLLQLVDPISISIPLSSGKNYNVRIIWFSTDSKLYIAPESDQLLAA